MRHKAQLSISRLSYGYDRRKIKIIVQDTDAEIKFLEIEMDLCKFVECITGLPSVDCDMELKNIQNLGKQKERKTIEFQLPKEKYLLKDEEIIEIAKKHVPEGWTCDMYFDSKGSFFTKDDKRFARTDIVRWITKGGE